MVLVLGSVSGVVAITDSRPCVVCRPSMAASYFLLLAQKKVTQKKGTLASAVCRASMPGKLREQAPGSAHGTSMCRDRTRAHPARARCAAISCACSPRPRGDPEEQSEAVPAAEASDISDTSVLALRSSPLSSGGGWTEKPRAPHAGGAMDRADSAHRPWMACGPNPSARSEPSPSARARIRGCLFFWLLSFWQTKESNWPPWMADKKHTDVSRLSRSDPKAKVK